jgi:hypothetical protein
MPSCPTKSFAAFRCLHASLRLRPRQRPAANDRFRTRRIKDRSALARLGIVARRWLSAPGKQRGKPLNNANGRDGRSLKSDVARLPRRLIQRPHGRRADFSAFVLLTLIVAGHAAAATEDAAQLFHTGRIAFENEDFSAALEAFESAVRAGLPGPAVQFNIGVAAFRLKRFERAEAAFLEAASTPSMAALAHYNLGLVALGRAEPGAARRWFARAAQEADDERLRTLAQDQLAALPPSPPDSDWAGYASVGSGYDDNVALRSDSDVLGVSGAGDGYFDVQLAVSAPLAQSWRFNAGVIFLDYQDLHEFDQFGIQGGPQYRVQSGDWTHDLAVKLAYSTLDGEGFENGRMLALQTSRRLSAEWRMDLRYRFSDLDGMNEFTGVGGERHEAIAHIERRRGPWNLAAEYEIDVSDHVDEALSATRHQVVLDVRRDLSDVWSLALAIAAHNGRYDAEGIGEEKGTEFAFQITRALSARWRLAVRYARTDNDADLAEYTYERNRVAAVIEAVL